MTARLLGVLAAVLALAAAAGGAVYAVAQAAGTGFDQMRGDSYAMMGSRGAPTAWSEAGTGSVRDIAAARRRAQRFADRLGTTTGEIMQFSNNFYVQLLNERGRAATEVLVDPQTGAVTLEYGPAMMWNTDYGMMGSSGSGGMMGGGSGGMMGGMMGDGSGGMMGGSGMMGRVGGTPSWTPSRSTRERPVPADEARRIADAWLTNEGTGLTAADPVHLPGYFTIDTLANGRPEGMLSVNEATGAVWYHWWHGRFVAMDE